MYFWFFKLKNWGKKTAETRRRNCAVLPWNLAAQDTVSEWPSQSRRAAVTALPKGEPRALRAGLVNSNLSGKMRTRS